MRRVATLTIALAALALLPAASQAGSAPDLTVAALTPASATATAGERLMVAVRTSNRGRRTARRSTTGIYLSMDSKRSREDIQLGADGVPALKKGKSNRTSTSLRLAAFLPAGRYRVLACADDTRRVAESSERNNCRVAVRVVTLSGSGISPQPVRVTVTTSGNGTGSVVSTPAAINCPATCAGIFGPGTAVRLTATPAAGSRFGGWSGGCSGSDPVCLAGGDADAAFVKRITASGAATSGGTVKVSSADPAASCSPAGCEVDAGQDVTYSATPSPGFRFASWIGDCAGGAATVTLTGTSSDTSCIASFSGSFRVSWNASPAAGGTIAGGIISGTGTCDAISCSVDPASGVQLNRTTTPGYRFLGWNNACAPDNPLNAQITVSNIQADYTCTASFVQQHTISFTVKSGGVADPTAGTVTLGTTTGFVVCQSSSCVGDMNGATPGQIGLTPSPNAGFRFAGWSCTGDATSPLVLSFTTDRVCDANFVRQYTVSWDTNQPANAGLQVDGQVLQGPGSCGNTSCTVDSGGAVLLTATSFDANWVFDQWTGDCGGVNNTVTLDNLGANKTCTAQFIPYP